MGFIEELNDTHAKISFNHSMKKHTGYGVGGKAFVYAEVNTLFSLNQIISICNSYQVNYKVVGNGTNILVSDKGYGGVIINTRGLSDVFFNQDLVRATAGASLQKLIKFCMDNGLTGLEPLSGIPATIGGAVVMNAGAFGKNISDRLVYVETLLNGKVIRVKKEDCEFGYRTSRFLGKNEVVVSATFTLERAEKELVQAGVEAYKDLRKGIQPTGKSCGSVFKNPVGNRAGRLIDSLNLKGLSIGGARVSNEHANFIITDSKATANDVKTLINYIKKKVLDEFNINLKEEIEYVGEF